MVMQEEQELIKRLNFLITIAENFRAIKRTKLAEKFGYKRLTQKAKKEIVRKYRWGAVLYLEDLIGFSYDTLVTITASASLRTSKYLSDRDVEVVNILLTIEKSFEEYVNKKPDIKALRKFMGKAFVDTGVGTFRELVSKLIEFNIFVAQGTLENISGFSYKNFILINAHEKEERQLWTLIHEIFHLTKGEHGFRKLKNPEELHHENEVANYIFRKLGLPEKPVTLEEVKRIKNTLDIRISLNALIRYYKNKGLYIDSFDPSKVSRVDKETDRRLTADRVKIKFPCEYIETLRRERLKDEQLMELFGLNPYMLEVENASVHEYLKANYCY